MLASACTEEVIRIQKEIDTVYVDRTPVRQVFNVRSLDSIRTITTQVDTITIIEAQIDTVFLTETEFIIDTVEVVIEQIDTLFIETVRIDTVERQANITYDPIFESPIESFFARVDNSVGRSIMLDVDVEIKVHPEGNPHFLSEASISNGGWTIYITGRAGCVESCIYRELLHCLWGVSYRPAWEPWEEFNLVGDRDNVMVINWPICLEGKTNEQKEQYITKAFVR